VATTLFWGYNFVSLKVLYAEMTPAAVGVVRFLLMWALLVLVCRALGVPIRVERRHLGWVWASGMVAMGIYMVFFLEGMRNTSAAEGAIILSTAPIITYLIAIAWRLEGFKWAALVGTLVAFVGVAIVVGGGSAKAEGTLLGNALVFLSAIVWASGTFVTRPLLAQYDPLTVLTASMPGAIPVLAIYGGRDAFRVDWAGMSMIGWANLAQVTALSGVVAFIGFYRGVRDVGPAIATRYQFFVPVLAAFFSWWVLNRPLQPVQWLGVLTVIAGVATTVYVRSKTPAPVQLDSNDGADGIP